jgi:hypothetical protein
MQSISEFTEPVKASKIFFATLRDEVGTLMKVHGEILFIYEGTGAISAIEPEDCVWLCVLGEVGAANGQQVLDTMHGNAPRICTSRAMEVR